MYGCETDTSGCLHTVIHRDLAHQPWGEVAEFFIIFTLFVVLDLTQASIFDFVIRCVVDLFFFFRSVSSKIKDRDSRTPALVLLPLRLIILSILI